MMVLLKALALQFLAGRTIGGVFSLLLLVLAPLAGVLKFIGLPLLLVLGLIGAPLFLLLGAIGLPMVFVVGIGGAIMLLVGVLLAIGVVAIKVVLPIVLIVWFVRWIMRSSRREPPIVKDPEPGLDGI